MKIAQIEYARGLAAILVVLYHVQITFFRDKYFGIGVWSGFEGGRSGVQVFFVISGFVIYYVHGRDAQGSMSAVRSFVWKRFSRIYPPLWAVLMVLTLIAASGAIGIRGGVYDHIAAFLILPAREDILLAVEWTLRHEILFYAIFAVFIFNRAIGMALLVAWGGIGTLAGFLIHGHWLFEFLFNHNHLLFLFGIGLAIAARRPANAPLGKTALAVGLLLFVAAWSVSVSNAAFIDSAEIVLGGAAALVLYGLMQLHWLATLGSLGRWLADASYAIYLVHYPVVSICCKLLVGLGGYDHVVVRIVYFIVVVVACLSAGFAFHRFVERPLLRLLNRCQPGVVSIDASPSR